MSLSGRILLQYLMLSVHILRFWLLMLCKLVILGSNTEIDIIVQANISWSTTIIFFVAEPFVPERYTVGGGNESFT